MELNALASAHYGISRQKAAALPSFARFIVNISITVSFWAARSRSCRILATLTADELRDIGMTCHQAKSEAAKKFYED